ncbi:MCM OB domain [Trinorchestia longiramus]|nr:MCM OB domain [Trinorchestia longiramus]
MSHPKNFGGRASQRWNWGKRWHKRGSGPRASSRGRGEQISAAAQLNSHTVEVSDNLNRSNSRLLIKAASLGPTTGKGQPVITTLLPRVSCPFKGWHLYMTEGYTEGSETVRRTRNLLKYLLRSTTAKDREAVWLTCSFRVSLKELISDAELQSLEPSLSCDAESSPKVVLDSLGLAMHQILYDTAEAAIRKDTTELLNLTLAQQQHSSSSAHNETCLPTSTLPLADGSQNNSRSRNDDANVSHMRNNAENSYGNVNTGLNTSVVSEDSVLAAMPDIKVPLVSARLQDDREGRVTPLKDLKANFYGKLVCISGTVVRVSSVGQRCVQLAFSCQICMAVFGLSQPDARYITPSQCPSDGCLSRQFTALRSHSLTHTIDHQTVRVQENNSDASEDGQAPEHGRVPRCVECHLSHDLVDACIPGDLVTITGTVTVEQCGDTSGRQSDACMFLVCVDVCSIDTCKTDPSSAAAGSFTITDYYDIRAVHARPSLFRLLVHSLCPTIYGQELVKAGLLLCLFGGCGSADGSGVGVRGEAHILVVGDPGLGKSQMLQACANIAPRGVFVCGNTATSAGLTVTLSREAGSGDYSLEGGALVLADRGVCCIDELDKMQHVQHQALLEGMEQQHISVAKGGLVCTLPARAAVLAAANPMHGHYNKSKTVAENLKISAPLLSRFDLLFILLDSPNEERDALLSRHVMALHSEGGRKRRRNNSGLDSTHGSSVGNVTGLDSSVLETGTEQKSLSDRLRYALEESEEPLPPSTLRKFICYARRYVEPKLSTAAAKLLQTFYLELRGQHHTSGGSALPITTRHLEALVRLTQVRLTQVLVGRPCLSLCLWLSLLTWCLELKARAKCELREEATEADARDVVELMRHSMIDTYSDELGHLHFDRSSHASGSSNRGQVGSFNRGQVGSCKRGQVGSCNRGQAKRLLSTLQRHSDMTGKSLYSMEELRSVALQAQLESHALPGLVEGLNQQGFLIKKGSRLFQLVTAS